MITIINNRILRLALVSVVALSSAGFAVSSNAATSTANLVVSATILDACTIATTPITFGNYDHSAPTLTASGSVTITCTNGTAATITLGQGLQPDAASVDGVPLRQMASGVNRLSYFLYQDAGLGSLWGNTPATGVPQTGTGDAGTTLTVYGAVPTAQNALTGAYTDTVLATVTF